MPVLIPDEASVVNPSSGITPDQTSIQQAIQPDPDSIQQPEGPVDGKYGSIPQQAMTGLEGFARGMTAGISDMAMRGAREAAEKYSNDPDFWAPKIEDANARSKTDLGKGAATAGTVASLLSERGVPGMLGKVLPATSIGSAALNGAIQSGAIQGGDELSKAMLGKGDPSVPVSSVLLHIGGAGVLGAVTGGAFYTIRQSLAPLENAKVGDKARDFLSGMGMAAKAHQAGVPAELVEEHLTPLIGEPYYKAYKPGIDFYYGGLKNLASSTAVGLGGAAGEAVSGPMGAIQGARIADKHLTPIIEKIINRPLIGMSKMTMPVVMKVLSSGHVDGLLDMLNYSSKVAKGVQSANNAIEALFKSGITPTIRNYEGDENRIREYIDGGGVTQQLQNQLEQQPKQYAEGGKVEDPSKEHALAQIYPEQNIMLNSARGRVSGYLTSVKPQKNNMKLAFDKEFKDEDKHRRYDRAVKIAANPLSVMKHIKDNTLQTEHVQHLEAMYPEVYQHLKNKLTDRITKAQFNEEMPANFATRQSMSLFLGTPLESSLTPQNIMAAQSVFAPQQTPAQQNPQPSPNKPKKATAKLGSKTNTMYQTADQSAEADRSGRK